MTIAPITRDLLIEIGTEELPATSQEALASSLVLAVNSLLRRNNIAGKQGQPFSTPRRIAALISEVPIRQGDTTVEKKGPSLEVAFDKRGQPTEAARGFARSVNSSIDRLERRNTGSGSWLWYTNRLAGKDTLQILRNELGPIFESLPVGRGMRWGTSNASFIRPVRWLVVKFGEEKVECSAFGLAAGDTTHGHRVNGNGHLEIASPGDYVETLKRAHVIVSAPERKKIIKNLIMEKGRELGCLPAAPEKLIEEICGMVEWPSAVVGKFDESYLQLPEDVIISTLVGHQRFVPMRDSTNKLLRPAFVAICNLPAGRELNIRRGLEKVVRPRLADAEFYYLIDRKRSLASYQEDLSGISFAPKLGNMKEKTERLINLVVSMSKLFGCDPVLAAKAASLCKCDLVTGLVFEFPELQGRLGSTYAREDGEDDSVVAAIAEHYRPAGPDDQIPNSRLGQLVAFADRLDTLVGGFAAGLKATATKDAFGMRRSAFAIVRIAMSRPLGDILPLLEMAASQYPKPLGAMTQLESAKTFLVERLRSYLRNSGHPADVITAVLRVTEMDPWDITQRISSIETLSARSDFVALVEVNKRLANILGGYKGDERWKPTQGAPIEEKELGRCYLSIKSVVEGYLEERNYLQALEQLTALREPLGDFFTEVLVMDDDISVRSRRLALLSGLYTLCRSVADIGSLQPTEGT